MTRKNIKNLNCCEKCQHYWICENKWTRGERKEENVCCTSCSSYNPCWGLVACCVKK